MGVGAPRAHERRRRAALRSVRCAQHGVVVSEGPSERSRRILDWLIAHGKALWVVAFCLAIPAGWRTAALYLRLDSDVEALLPRDAPSVRAIDELRRRMPGLKYLGVVVDTGAPENIAAGERFVDDLAARVRTYPPNLVRRVRTGSAEEKRFLEENAPLYLSVADLDAIQSRIERRRDWEITKESGNALDEDEAAPPLDFSDIEKKYDAKLGGQAKTSESARFSDATKHLTAMLIEVGESQGRRASAAELLARVKSDVAALGGPARYAPGMRVGYTGDVAISVEETEALEADLASSTLVVVALTVLVLAFYYRWSRSVLIILPPLLLATIYAFALASLPPFHVRELNSNTAFLGSIVIGNGINFSIILLARYVEERRRGRSQRESIAIAHAGTRAGTIAAACAAGSSYAALALTDFQGFHQFGYIGGIGMIVSWITAYALIPSLVLRLDHGAAAAPRPGSDRTKPMAYVARAVTSAPLPFVIVALLATVGSAWALRTFDASSLEHDFSKLRRKDTWVSGEGYWGRKMDALLGTYLTPIVILADDPEKARAIGAALRQAMKSPPLDAMIASVRTAADVVPDDQRQKIEKTRDIRALLTPAIRSLVPPEKKAALNRFVGEADPEPVTARDLPESFVAGLREHDGRIDRSVLVFPRPSHALWEGPAIAELVSALREAAKAGPGPPGRVAGSLPVSADILGSIEHDGPIASAAALLFVVLVVVALFGFGFTSGVVLTALLLGVVWLGGATMLFHVKINFANFIAFPITFGIGVDYAVNVMNRYVSDGRADVGAAIRSTGGAVGLCSLTTVIGYSSLLMANNRALYLFGVIAVLGEITCLAAAVVALPSALTLLHRRRRRVPVERAKASR
jgi:predicted RND superfamily exporter protein